MSSTPPTIQASVTGVKTERPCGFNKEAVDKTTLWNNRGLSITLTTTPEVQP